MKCQSEVGTIKKVVIKHTRDAFISQDNIDSQWEKLNFLSPPDFNKALDEYDEFVKLLQSLIPEVKLLPESENTTLDSLYTHDPVIMTRAGTILCTMGKDNRKGEPEAMGDYLESIGIPILGEILPPGKIEGGDTVWLDPDTLAVGVGYRSNMEGIRQLRILTEGIINEITPVSLPHWQGPDDVLHLMSMISPVDSNLAVVYSPLMAVEFREELIRRGIKLIEVPDDEYETMACNILAVAPRKVIIISGNPKTKKFLEDEGVEVFEFTGDDISRKGAGGPTCLTRAIEREEK